ncbi:MAG: DUF190 domain-containing protein [Proteobacteria bacterium]|nr:DUF190 domain-containing protein [Pseudomonadota bacterium]
MHTKEVMLLRIFITEDDQAGHEPLYQAILEQARKLHLAGATLLRGPMGFGRSGRLHNTKILRLSEKLPVVIEILDCEEKISSFLPVLETLIESGIVTLEKVKVVRFEK